MTRRIRLPRIHLMTSILAMLVVSVLMGLNLNKVVSCEYQFNCNRERYTAAILTKASHSPCTVWKYSRWQSGWPWMLAKGFQSSNTTVADASVPELKQMPIHIAGCLITSLDREEFARKAPDLFHKFALQPAQYSSAEYQIQYDGLAKNLAVISAILLSIVSGLEWLLRRKTKPGPQLSPRPELS